MNRLAKCKCNATPELVKICEWPAQYKAQCKCGKEVRGVYYGSHDRAYRHQAAKKACIEAWNNKHEKNRLHSR